MRLHRITLIVSTRKEGLENADPDCKGGKYGTDFAKFLTHLQQFYSKNYYMKLYILLSTLCLKSTIRCIMSYSNFCYRTVASVLEI